jgi:hypothetical protein
VICGFFDTVVTPVLHAAFLARLPSGLWWSSCRQLIVTRELYVLLETRGYLIAYFLMGVYALETKIF